MFGNNGGEFVTLLLKQPKYKSEQMSLSLLKQWIVTVPVSYTHLTLPTNREV